MSVCEDSQKINVTEKVHKLYLAGIFNDIHKVLVMG